MRNSIRFVTLSAVALGSAMTLSSAANAAQFFVGAGAVQPNSNVLFTGDPVGNPIVATLNNSPATVNFASNESLTGPSNGQARVTGSTDSNLTQLIISLSSGFSFSAIEFNLNALTNGTASIVFAGSDGITSGPQSISSSGQNFFSATGNFNTVTINSTAQLSDVRQIRITAIPSVVGAVPEPATWAMMLVGFGAAGISMRRRRSRDTVVRTQVA